MRIYLMSFLVLIGTMGFAQTSVIASYYHSMFEGRTTSSGTKYRADSLTCAHRTLPFGTRLKVENPENKNFVIVKVTDRGPFIRGREIDLSYAAADQLDIINKGIAEVTLTMLREFRFTPAISFDKNGLFLAEKAPHDPYTIYDADKVLYTQR